MCYIDTKVRVRKRSTLGVIWSGNCGLCQYAARLSYLEVVDLESCSVKASPGHEMGTNTKRDKRYDRREWDAAPSPHGTGALRVSMPLLAKEAGACLQWPISNAQCGMYPVQ